MPRKHAFMVVVLLGAVFVAGVLAVSRTVVLGQPARASTSSDPAIAFRMKKLDRFEASLERRASALDKAQASGSHHLPPLAVHSDRRARVGG